jgi:pimeloyl-ACP methyl ester carboxylesterase
MTHSRESPDFLDTSERFVDVPGGSVYVRVFTPPAPALGDAEPISGNSAARMLGAAAHERIGGAAPVILLHDSLGCVEMWREFPSLLAEKLLRPVIAYDRLGFGRSSRRAQLPSIRFIEEEAEIYFPAILAGLGIRRFIAFGHSVGGAMAVIAAARLARDCEAIVTESAQAFVQDQTLQSIAEAKKSFEDPRLFERLARYHGENAGWVLRAWTDTWLSPEFASWSLEKDLPLVRCPLLAIHGVHDEFGSVRFPETLSELAGGPAEKLIIEDCGHVPHREKGSIVLDAVDRFLRQSTSHPGNGPLRA